MIKKFVLHYLYKFSLKYCAYNICETCPFGDKINVCFITKLERMMKDDKKRKRGGKKIGER